MEEVLKRETPLCEGNYELETIAFNPDYFICANCKMVHRLPRLPIGI